MKKIAAFAVLLISAAFAVCGGSASHYIPALVEGEGVLVNVSMELGPGDGGIFVGINPKVGLSAQESMQQAVEYAFMSSGGNLRECEVRIRAHLPEGVGGYVDGPSGGAGMALMAIAALEGKRMREDAMITGTVNSKGLIGPVGGLYEKAKIARENGLDYFVTPLQSLYERVMLRLLQEEDGMAVVEVADMAEARDFMLDGNNGTRGKRPPMIEKIDPGMEPYYGRQEFRGAAEEMIAKLNASIAGISPEITEAENLTAYFRDMQENERMLMDKGYYFSAANDAFMKYLDAETIANVEGLDVEAKVRQVDSCLANARILEMTDANFEWVAGQELRKGWADGRLEEVGGGNYTLKEEKYFAYHDAMYADAWCAIVGMLGRNAPSWGDGVDEGALANLSGEYLGDAEKANASSEDAIWHLENARRLHSRGDYAGAIYDSVFVMENTEAINLFDSDEGKATEDMERLGTERRSSFWGDIYASHGRFVMLQGDNASAYGLFRFAKGLDNATARMRAVLEASPKQEEGPGAGICAYGLAAVLVALCAAAAYLHSRTQQKNKVFKRKKRQ